MTRGLPLFLGLLVVLQCSVLSRAECDITKCEIPKHYREVAGCEPAKYAEGDEEKCCPIEYNCEAVSKQDKTKCHYKGKVYNDGEILENDDMPNCRRGCFCREGDFVCAHVECPEQVFNRPAPHCVIQSSRTKCCSESILCEEEKIEKLSTCYMDSKLYRQGEKMYPKDERCFTCICDEKWDNSTAITKNPACEEVDCAIDISFQSDLRMGCVPIYYGEPTCCPIDRKCRKYRFWVDNDPGNWLDRVIIISTSLFLQPNRKTSPSPR